MAHKAECFKVEKKKVKKRINKQSVEMEVNVIILYTNVEVSPAEQMLIDRYLDMGYEPMFEEKKSSKSVKEMRKEMKNDEKALAEFNRIYKTKPSEDATKEEKSNTGFFGACKYYSKWVKEQKDAKKKAEANAEEEKAE